MANSVRTLIYQNESAPNSPIASGGVWNAIAATSKIDQLSGTRLSNITVSGVSGLMAADIPTDITAANYLPLAGGTITGDLNVTGSFSGGSVLVSGASSTNATSTNLFSSNATSTNLFASLGHFTSGVIDTLTATAATITNLIATTITGTNATFTNATTTNATSTNAFATNVMATNGMFTNATSTNFFASLGHFTTGIIDTLTATAATITNLIATTITGTNATFINATTTNATSTNSFAGNFNATNATTTSLFASTFGLSSGNYFTSLLGAGLANISGALSLDLAHVNIWTGLQQFFGNASTTQLSATTAYFGGTATSTFTSAGWLGIGTTSPASALSVSGNGYFTGGLEIGSPTGGMPSTGVINAQGLQINGSAIGASLSAGIDTVTVVNPGTGYVPSTPPNTADVVTLSGGTETTNGVVYIMSTQVVSATVASGGTGCANGTKTVTGTTGGDGWNVGIANMTGFVASQKFQAQVTVSGNTITAVNSITVPGVYFINPTTLSAEPVTGGGCSGATLSLTMGALSAAVQNAGSYTAVSGTTATLTQRSDSTGSGTGATFTATFKSVPQNTGNGAFGGPFNTVFGYQAGAANVGDSNTFFGWEAGTNNTIGKDNVFIGPQAGVAFTGAGDVWPDTGQDVFIGSLAGQAATNAIADVFVGQKAGEHITTGSNNVCVGTHSCTSLTTSQFNVFIGQAAGNDATTTGTSNVVIGAEAGQYLTGSAGTNVLIGFGAGQGTSIGSSNSGSNNVIVGNIAGAVLTTATQSAFLGSQAGNAVTSGAGNTLLGYQAGFRTTTGINNMFVGSDAGANNTTGSRDIYIGVGAGSTAPVNVQNVFIAGATNNERIDNVFFGKGYVDTSATAYTINGTGGLGSNTVGGDINLAGGIGVGSGKGGDIVFKGAPTGSSGTATSTLAEVMRITNGGLVGIGTTTPYSRLEVWGPDAASSTAVFTVVSNASTTEFAVFDGGNAQLAGTLTQSSDQRLKQNIVPLDASSTLALITQLNPVNFNWIDPNQGSGPQVGFIAQAVQKIFPNLVATTSPTALTPDGTLGVNYIGFIAPIVKAVQALAADIVSIKNTIAGFATIFHTQELCVGSTCINQQQLAAILTSAGQASAPLSGSGQGSSPASGGAASSTSDASTTSPIISINGDNPAIIHIGDTYSDLGATITGPAEDLNLGVHTYVGTTPIEFSVIDTKVPATYHIYYVATDSAGNTATSTRTVIVGAATTTTP